MFCCMRASVSGHMALLVLWIFHYIYSSDYQLAHVRVAAVAGLSVPLRRVIEYNQFVGGQGPRPPRLPHRPTLALHATIGVAAHDKRTSHWSVHLSTDTTLYHTVCQARQYALSLLHLCCPFLPTRRCASYGPVSRPLNFFYPHGIGII